MFEFSDVGEYTGFLSELDSHRTYGAVVVVKNRKHRDSLYEVEITLPPQYSRKDYPSWLFSKDIPSTISVSRKLLDGVCLIGCTAVSHLPDARITEQGVVDGRVIFTGNVMKLHARLVVDSYGDESRVASVRRQYDGLDSFVRNHPNVNKSSHIVSKSGGITAAISDLSEPTSKQRNLVFQTITEDRHSLWVPHVSSHDSFKGLLSVAMGKTSRVTGREESINGRDLENGNSWDRLNRSPDSVESNGIPSSSLFTLKDLPSDWFDRWNDLKTDYSRAIYAYLALLDRKDKLHVETACIHFGTIIEFIGSVAEDNNLKASGGYASCVNYLYDNVPQVEGLTDSWANSMPNTYNKTKHIDKNITIQPDEMIINTAIGMEIVRMWIAIQLGVSEDRLKYYYKERGGINTSRLLGNATVY